MPLKFCLPPAEADKFKKDILSGAIDPTTLAGMTSAERHDFFSKRFGEAMAGPMNTALEEKLLLKNQQAGMVNWAQRMMGGKKDAQKDIIQKIKNMEKLLTPKDEDSFLAELASHRLGTRISYDEAQKIAALSGKVDATKSAMANGGDRMEYGRAVVALRNYVGELKAEAEKMTLADAKKEPLAAAGKAITFLAGNAKSLKASMDDSALFRQGWKTLLTHPGVWQRNARQSFVDLARTFGGANVMDEVNADIFSRPTYDLMKSAGLAVGVGEEAFPESFAEKIPLGVGRAYRASEHAYNAFVRRTRADVFDKYLEIAQRSGVDLSDKEELQSIGKLTNSLTGRGHLGPIEPIANVVNNVFFSPRMMKSTFDTLTMHSTDKMSGFARKQAAINLVKILVGAAAILGIAKAIKHDSVDFDPRSANFGKIRVGNTRYDMTAGMSSMATLAARLLTMSSKSSTTGKVNPINSGKYGATTGTDMVYNFFENKLSPAASFVKDLIKGRTFSGDKPTIANELGNLFVPLPITNYQELRDDPKRNAANTIVAILADSLGISTNTYDGRKKKP